jgi:hypothetical protein
MKQRGLAVIAALEVVGGFAGLVVASQMALQSISVPIAALVFSLVALPMLLSLRAGQLLWQGQRNGKVLSLVVQLLQLPVIQIGALKYNFFVGARLAFLWITSDVYPRVDFGATLTVQVAGAVAPTVIGINVLALWALWYLWRRVPTEDLTRETVEKIAPAAA